MADENSINQEEIERLLSQGKAGASPGGEAAANSADPGQAASTPPGADVPESPSAPASAAPSSTLPGTSAAGTTAAIPATASAAPAADDKNQLPAQQGIEARVHPEGRTAGTAADAKTPPSSADLPGEGAIAENDVEYLLEQAEQALASINAAGSGRLPEGVAAFRLEEFAGAPPSTETATLDLVRDVELDLKIELGRTHMYLEDVLKLRKGSVVPLDKLAGDPVDIYVNGRLIARGEVLVLNDNFCVRVAELVAGTKLYG